MTLKKSTEKQLKRKQLFGIAEWYGRLYRGLSDAERKVLVAVPYGTLVCPFLADVPSLGPKSGKLTCSKAGGVCSLRNFHEPESTQDLSFGPISATCPNRFLERGVVVRHIGELLLGTESPAFAKELPFLKRPISGKTDQAIDETLADQDSQELALVDAGAEDVGRIDLVLVNPDDPSVWCAVEFQAVYFSGAEMGVDYAAIKAHDGNGIPMPAKGRRPDFRSSGPKRLMPQLMIKVPALRRWGHKMVVVVDEPFFAALDPMEEASHVSNSDIVWVVTKFDDSQGVGNSDLKIVRTVNTTLESAVKGLTAGRPTTLPEFEQKLSSKIAPTFPPPPPAAS